MWDLNTLKQLNNKRSEYLEAQKRREEEQMSKRERDYVWKHVPVHMQDKGGYDEGYYYTYCYNCSEKTEHEDECCCVCSAHNPD